MNEPFDLPVNYKGKQLLFPARLLMLGYTHKFQVQVNGFEVLFEPDEERNYRAVVAPEQAESSKIDVELIKAIAEVIEAVVK
ncbi:MAG: hypothetical protein ICV84_25940 [Flavisolibacter sp.]|nr:hypothetical protein [Flavisolibacter sp.]MBD0298602.1 hypothetical protein [Flavisolibacter sp.]